MTEIEFIAEPGKQELIIRSRFDAPREQVFKVYIDPKLLPDWWGPANVTTNVEKWEPRPGGSWRVIQRDPEGNMYGFHGVFHEVVQPERITWTFEYEEEPGHITLETVTFQERNGRTEVTSKSIYQSVEDRDASVQSGMEQGVREGNERLAKLLEKAKAA